jgi:hypothetical protein
MKGQELRLLPFSREDEITQTRAVSYSCNTEYRLRGLDLISDDFGPVGSLSPGTILSNPLRSGLRTFGASSVDAWGQMSSFPGAVRITHMALGSMGPTTPFDSEVRN